MIPMRNASAPRPVLTGQTSRTKALFYRITPAGAIALLALIVRAYQLRETTLAGIGGYDDAVHYAGAMAIVLGKVPYRDFLFLHPPGILVFLLPFAELGRSITEATGMAAARGAWILMGAFNSAGVAVLLRSQGLAISMLAGISYAIYAPAVETESSVLLESLSNTLLVAALLLIFNKPTKPRLLLAGALIGFIPVVKIWGIVILLAVLAWAWLVQDRRSAFLLAGGAVTAATALVLPFFLMAPQSMWQMTITAQLGRPRESLTFAQRLSATLGLPEPAPPDVFVYWLSAVVGLILITTLIRTREIQLASLSGLLLAATAPLLLVTPSFYPHYSALIAVPFVLTIGLALHSRLHAPFWQEILKTALTLGIAGWIAAQLCTISTSSQGRDISFERLRPVVQLTDGCISTDHPMVLIILDVFGRNIERGCPVVIDLTGYSYVTGQSGSTGRANDPEFQRHIMRYLATSEIAIIGRNSYSHYLSQESAETVATWTKLGTFGRFTAYRTPR